MLLLRLSSKQLLNLYVNQPRSMIRCLTTSHIKFESETSRLLRARKEREAREELTTGFDKMIQSNIYHLQIMKRNETPEIARKRSIALFKMIFNLLATTVGIILATTVLGWFMAKMCSCDPIASGKELTYWLDGNPLDRFKKRPYKDPLPFDSAFDDLKKFDIK